MKEYHAIQTGTWLPRNDVDPLTAVYYGFTMPKPWRETVQRVVDLSKGRPDSYIPLGRLNQVVEATAPDFVHAISEPRELDQPWLYAERPMSTSMMRKLLKAWLIDIAGNDGKNQRQAFAALREIDFSGHDELWRYGVVNLWESDDPSKGGTARPKRELFRLLPDVIASEIESLGPYEHLGTKVHFRQVACSSGAQLMAFPPLRHQDRRTKQHWYFSPFIHVSLHTVPFSPVPRVHLHLGMRRWVRWLPAGEGKQAPLRLPRKNGISVYLRLESPWAELETPPQRIARAIAERKDDGFRWRTGGTGNMLARLGEFGDFPDLEELLRDTHQHIGNAEAGTWAALVYNNNLSAFHKVDPGFSPTEHMRVLEWAGQALERHYRIAPTMDKSSKGAGKPKPFMKKPTSKDPEKAEATAQEGFAAYRALIRKGVGEELHATLLYQETDGVIREAVVAAACAKLGAAVPEAAYDTNTKRYVYRIEVEDLRVVLTAHPIADLGRSLFPSEEKSKGGKAHEQAERERAEELKRYLTDLGVTGELLFVELPDADGFKGPKGYKDLMRDPKFALRRGAALAGKVAQFVTPRKTIKNKPEEDEYLRARAGSTWEDGLRQIGVRFVPRHSVGETAPERLNYLGVWAVQKNWRQRNRHGMFEPVAVLISPGEPRILARTFDTPGWVPYPEMLRQFALATESPKDLRNRDAKHEHFAAFMRGTLRSPAVRRFPTVLFASALNSRSADRWDWLQDAKIEPDAIQFGKLPVQSLGLHGKGLRLVRVRKEGGRRETPQWWAPDHEPERAPHLREAGQTVGLWHLPGDPDRVYYSTAEKNARIVGGLNRNLAKLTDWQRTYAPEKESEPQSPQPDKAYPMPDLLEIAVLGLQEGDEPRDWAYLTHQLRFPDEYTEGLALPLPLKLAEDIGEYAYPDAAERDPEVEDLEIDEPQQPELFGFNDLVNG